MSYIFRLIPAFAILLLGIVLSVIAFAYEIRSIIMHVYRVKGNDVASGNTVKSMTPEVGKDEVLSPNKEAVQDDMDIMVDAIQLG